MPSVIATPVGLGAEGLRLWTEVTASYGLRPDERRVLEDACREVDLIEQMRLALPKDRRRLTVRGSMGQNVAHPLIGELRQHRTTLANLLKLLKLADLAGAEGEKGESDTSTKARHAAISKWGRR